MKSDLHVTIVVRWCYSSLELESHAIHAMWPNIQNRHVTDRHNESAGNGILVPQTVFEMMLKYSSIRIFGCSAGCRSSVTTA